VVKVDRAAKANQVAQLRDIFGKAALVVVTQQSGLTVAEATDLRKKVRAAGARFKVTKNRLARLALKDTKFNGLADRFKGPTAIAYSTDPVAAAKVVAAYAKDNKKLTIVAGCLDGSMLDQAGVDTLAKLPSLDELRGRLIGMIQTPAQRLAVLAQAPASQLARVFAAYGKKEAA
jgi:large subunit ribosomal protein L10